ncbi:hypothetical protein B0H21DRAFT_714533, partial [Amylocystis lapponica]
MRVGVAFAEEEGDDIVGKMGKCHGVGFVIHPRRDCFFPQEAVMKLTMKEMLSIIPSSVSFPARVRHRKGDLLSAAVEAGFRTISLALADAKAEQRSADAVERQRRKRQRDRENQSSARRNVESQDGSSANKVVLPILRISCNCHRTQDCEHIIAHFTKPPRTRRSRRMLRSRNGHPAENIVEDLVLAGEGVMVEIPARAIFASVGRACWIGARCGTTSEVVAGEWLVDWKSAMAASDIDIPEQLLIAHPISPRSALAGNVSTFEFNMDKIADMIDGRLLPQHPSILASVLSVTYVGSSKLPSSGCGPRFPFVGVMSTKRSVAKGKQSVLRHLSPLTVVVAAASENDVPVEIVANARHEED